jgi:hypothetical protein
MLIHPVWRPKPIYSCHGVKENRSVSFLAASFFNPPWTSAPAPTPAQLVGSTWRYPRRGMGG